MELLSVPLAHCRRFDRSPVDSPYNVPVKRSCHFCFYDNLNMLLTSSRIAGDFSDALYGSDDVNIDELFDLPSIVINDSFKGCWAGVGMGWSMYGRHCVTLSIDDVDAMTCFTLCSPCIVNMLAHHDPHYQHTKTEMKQSKGNLTNQ